MKYVSYIFEDQDVRNTVSKNEYLVEVASNAVIHHNALLEAYVYNNLEQFTGNNLAEIYENIRSFIIKENLAVYSQYSEILSDNQLSEQDKVACFESDVAAAAEAVGKFGLKGVLPGVKSVISNIGTGFSHVNRVNKLKQGIADTQQHHDNQISNAQALVNKIKMKRNKAKENIQILQQELNNLPKTSKTARSKELRGGIEEHKQLYNNAQKEINAHKAETKRMLKHSEDEVYRGARDHRYWKKLLKQQEKLVEPIENTKAFRFGSHLANHGGKYAKVTASTAGVGTAGVAGKYAYDKYKEDRK